MKKSTITLLSLSSFLVSVVAVPSFAEVQPASMRYAEELSTTFEQVADTITPSVVNIQASSAPKVIQGMPQGLPQQQLPPPFQDFFRQFPLPQMQQAPKQALGSGVIIDSKGHILTNNHVVEGFEEFRVHLSDKRTFPAKIIGTDPSSDLAVIKIEANNLVPAALGDSDKLRIGEWVVAAGSPFGLENTITTGIVSAKGRSFGRSTMYQDYIQTDAAINPGNSGGPLVNLRGEVIGINNSIYTRSGGYMGIGFAIPINMAKYITNSILTIGHVRRGWLGVAIQDLDENLAKSFNYTGTSGALVGDVMDGSPADQAGLQSGDIVTRLNGTAVEDTNDLRNSIAAITPGTQVTLDVLRTGRELALKVKLGELPSKFQNGESSPTQQPNAADSLGLDLEELTPQLAQRLDLENNSGVVVVNVTPGSAAAIAGIQPGDIIRKVGDASIENLTDFRAALKKSELEEGVRLVVETKGMKRFIFLQAS
ncbi:MAG: Do family serine endopeptidase [Bdellovibrionales bacterium]|nr:Do family serine endopeptidase [Bdellovibrionales bacterium]